MWKEYEAAWYRRAELLEEAERRSLTRLTRQATCRPSLRARVARRLVDAAFALENRETWRSVWERMM
jgi:anti-sigma-K factor RskA